MTQTHLLELPRGLAVRFTFLVGGVDVAWSRRPRRTDLPNLEKYYVPWRNRLLTEQCESNPAYRNFIDIPMIELVTRKKR